MLFRISSLDVYKYTFMLALFAAESMLLLRLPRKPHFCLRMAVSLLTLLLVATVYPVIENNAFTNSLMFGCFFVVSVLLAKFCYHITWNSCLFCTVAGYSFQHIASILCNILVVLGGFGQSASLYSSEPASFNYLQTVMCLECYLLVYFLSYHFFVKKLDKNSDISITQPSLFGLIILMLVVEIILNAIVIERQNQSPDWVYFFSACATNMLCTLCVLMVLFGQLLRRNLENELDIVRQLRKLEKRQYDISRETIDMINIKCHDMKHQIRHLRHSGTVTNEALQEIEQRIGIYDSIVKTGSDALDIILAEKSFFCQKNGVSVNCIVDGERLRFMSEADIYSLFGNLLDNAIHSVMQLEEERRVVSLTVKCRGQLLSVNIHNPYIGTLKMENGIPQTTSNDQNTHGFGIKSVMMTVQKYGGSISFQTDDQIFNVNLLFPLSSDPDRPNETEANA